MTQDVPLTAICLDCDYPLCGLRESRCPECGRKFDPADPRTFGSTAELIRRRAWARPPPGWLLIVTFGLVILFLYWRSLPFGAISTRNYFDYEGTFLSLLALLLIALDYTARLVRSTWYRQPHGLAGAVRASNGRWRWFVTPLCIGLAISVHLAAWPAWPLRARFALSRADFERTVNDIRGGTTPNLPTRIGLYRVDYIERLHAGGVFFQTGRSGGRVGFAYWPEPRLPHSSIQRLSQCWYTRKGDS